MRTTIPTSSLEAADVTSKQSAVDHACTFTSTPAIFKTRTERLRRRWLITVVLCAGRGLALALLLRRRLRLGISRRRWLCRAGAPRPAAADQLHRLACRVYDSGLSADWTDAAACMGDCGEAPQIRSCQRQGWMPGSNGCVSTSGRSRMPSAQ